MRISALIRAFIPAPAAAAVLMLSTGCTTDWQRSFRPNSTIASTSFPTSESVQIRVVTVKQLDESNAATEKYFDDHNLAPEDMSADDAKSARQLMLNAFRIHEDAGTVALLGSSAFTGTAPATPDDAGLISFARSIGADFVVMATQYAGQKLTYTSVPETSYSTTTVTHSGGGGRHERGTDTYDRSTTTYIVIPVTYQQWSNVALYWRRVTPDERARLDANYPSAIHHE